MCRQAIFNKEGAKLIEQEYGGMEAYLDFLKAERGGNGNGYILVKDGKIVEFHKAAEELSTEEISERFKTQDYDWALFHTRLASVGDISDGNCHPFVKSNDFAVSMNGTEDEYSDPKEYDSRADSTDSERIATALYNSGKNPEEFLVGHGMESAFFGFYQGKPFVASNDRGIVRVLKTGDKEQINPEDAVVFASDFPWNYDGRSIYNFTQDQFYWQEGERLLGSIMQEAPTGITNLYDGLFRQLLDKMQDTSVTIVSQQTGIAEDLLHERTLGEILEMQRNGNKGVEKE